MRYDQAMLGHYLVQDVQDPRINVASVLTRHFLIRQLFPGRFSQLMRFEIQFAAAMNWLLSLANTEDAADRFSNVLMALANGESAADGIVVPRYIAQAFASLPAEADGMTVPDYLSESLTWLAGHACDRPADEQGWSTFQSLWRKALGRALAPRVSVLEPACGSANDYRFLDAFGIARFLNYTGFDLCEKNVRNARAMFPDVRFEVGNALEIGAADNAFDFCFVHDLFEHLSLEAMETAVAEVCRVTRRGLLAGFFRMCDADEHVVRPAGPYYVNQLSVSRTRALFARHATAVEVVRLDSLLRRRFGCPDTPNPNACVFTATL
jgi:SAM-dependent methyltransferase